MAQPDDVDSASDGLKIVFLIADIDSPRGGIVRVSPQNPIALQANLRE
jgi:hypothetical protein